MCYYYLNDRPNTDDNSCTILGCQRTHQATAQYSPGCNCRGLGYFASKVKLGGGVMINGERWIFMVKNEDGELGQGAANKSGQIEQDKTFYLRYYSDIWEACLYKDFNLLNWLLFEINKSKKFIFFFKQLYFLEYTKIENHTLLQLWYKEFKRARYVKIVIKVSPRTFTERAVCVAGQLFKV